MNKAILMGRLTRNPVVRYSQGEEQTAVARFTLAVNRKTRQENGEKADFPSCVAFGKKAEFAEKYLSKGTKVLVQGRIQTGSYINRDGIKIYTTDIICEDIEFTESKAAQERPQYQGDFARREDGQEASTDGFVSIPEGKEEQLPFS